MMQYTGPGRLNQRPMGRSLYNALSDDDTVDENQGDQHHRENASNKSKRKEPSNTTDNVDGGAATDMPGAEEELVRKKKQRRTKRFSEDMLLAPEGLHRIYEEFPIACKFHGRGSEARDIKCLMAMYREWAFQLHPSLSFQDVLVSCEDLGKLSSMRVALDEMRDSERTRYVTKVLGIKTLERPVDHETDTELPSRINAADISSSSVPPPVLQQQPQQASGPAPAQAAVGTSTHIHYDDAALAAELAALSDLQQFMGSNPAEETEIADGPAGTLLGRDDGCVPQQGGSRGPHHAQPVEPHEPSIRTIPAAPPVAVGSMDYKEGELDSNLHQNGATSERANSPPRVEQTPGAVGIYAPVDGDTSAQDSRTNPASSFHTCALDGGSYALPRDSQDGATVTGDSVPTTSAAAADSLGGIKDGTPSGGSTANGDIAGKSAHGEENGAEAAAGTCQLNSTGDGMQNLDATASADVEGLEEWV